MPITLEELGWQLVVYADDCEPCDMCGEPVCPFCEEHYAECDCPGPTQDDEYEYRTLHGREYARRLGILVEH